jgi:hypothetical protein
MYWEFRILFWSSVAFRDGKKADKLCVKILGLNVFTESGLASEVDWSITSCERLSFWNWLGPSSTDSIYFKLLVRSKTKVSVAIWSLMLEADMLRAAGSLEGLRLLVVSVGLFCEFERFETSSACYIEGEATQVFWSIGVEWVLTDRHLLGLDSSLVHGGAVVLKSAN